MTVCKTFKDHVNSTIESYNDMASSIGLIDFCIEFYIRYYGEEKLDLIGVDEKEFWKHFPSSYGIHKKYAGKMIIVDIKLTTVDDDGDVETHESKSFELFK